MRSMALVTTPISPACYNSPLKKPFMRFNPTSPQGKLPGMPEFTNGWEYV